MQRDKIKKVMDACYLAKRVRDLLPKLPNEKKAAKTDGRVVFIKITASGKDLVDKYVDQYFGELSAELDDISDADADNMIETIEKLYEVMKGRK